jgi:hypothetical protein
VVVLSSAIDSRIAGRSPTSMNPNKPVLSLSSRPAKRPGCDADAGDAEHGHRDLPGAPAQSVNGRGQAAGEDGPPSRSSARTACRWWGSRNSGRRELLEVIEPDAQ